METQEYRHRSFMLNKAIKKAVKQHRKRSHLRKELGELRVSWGDPRGGLSFWITRALKKRRKRLSTNVSNYNPAVTFLLSHQAVQFLRGQP